MTVKFVSVELYRVGKRLHLISRIVIRNDANTINGVLFERRCGGNRISLVDSSVWYDVIYIYAMVKSIGIRLKSHVVLIKKIKS